MSQNAQRTVALALAPSVSDEDWEEFVARTLAEAECIEESSARLAYDAREVLRRCFKVTGRVDAGVSAWPRRAGGAR